MNPANDTSALPLGATLQTTAWRSHRYADHIEVVSLANAGKRGKDCQRFVLSGRVSESVAEKVAAACLANVDADTMAGAMFCLADEHMEFSVTAVKGIFVDPRPAIEISEPTVRGKLTAREAFLTFVETVNTPRGPLPLDTHVSAVRASDAAKMRAWVEAHRAELAGMTATSFRRTMMAVGVTCS